MLPGRTLRKAKHFCSRVSCSPDAIYAKLSPCMRIMDTYFTDSNLFLVNKFWTSTTQPLHKCCGYILHWGSCWALILTSDPKGLVQILDYNANTRVLARNSFTLFKLALNVLSHQLIFIILTYWSFPDSFCRPSLDFATRQLPLGANPLNLSISAHRALSYHLAFTNLILRSFLPDIACHSQSLDFTTKNLLLFAFNFCALSKSANRVPIHHLALPNLAFRFFPLDIFFCSQSPDSAPKNSDLCANCFTRKSAHKVSSSYLVFTKLTFRFFSLPDIFLFLQCLPAIGGRRFTGFPEEGPIRTLDGWPSQLLVTTTQFNKMACVIPFRENSRSSNISSTDADNIDNCLGSCYDALKTITPEVLMSLRSSDFVGTCSVPYIQEV